MADEPPCGPELATPPPPEGVGWDGEEGDPDAFAGPDVESVDGSHGGAATMLTVDGPGDGADPDAVAIGMNAALVAIEAVGAGPIDGSATGIVAIEDLGEGKSSGGATFGAAQASMLIGT